MPYVPTVLFLLSMPPLLAAAPGGGAEAPAADRVYLSSNWKAGDSWELELEVYPRSHAWAFIAVPPNFEPKYRYRMTVRIAGTESVEGVLCWQVDFNPAASAPPELRDPTRVLIGVESGWVRRLQCSGEILDDSLSDVGGRSVLFDPPIGLPAEMYFFEQRQSEVRPAGSPQWIQYQRRDPLPVVVLETSLFSGDKPKVTVKQVWRKGDKFWSEYERLYNGRRELRARVVAPANAVPAVPQQAPRLPGLGSDSRLHPKLDVLIDDPSLGDLLTRIQQATGVNLIAEDVVLQHRPPVGRISFRGVTAHWFMDYLARKGLNEGRWEKTESGYRLVGNVGSEVQPAPSSVWKNPWLIGGILVGMAVLVIGGIVFLKGRRDSVRNG